MAVRNKLIVYFSVEDCFGREIRTTREYWKKIIQIKHTVIRGKEDQIKETLKNPDFVKVSKYDPKVFLYYKKVNKHQICVVARHEDSSGFIITAYITRSVAQGEIIWEK